MFPFPSIRFREETAEVTSLREREKGDWHKISVDEKKTCKYLIQASGYSNNEIMMDRILNLGPINTAKDLPYLY